MSRPLSSDVRYPFVPSIAYPEEASGIKDLVLVSQGPPSASVSLPGVSSRFASLSSIEAGPPYVYTFGLYVPEGDGTFSRTDIIFEVAPGEGFSVVRSTDGRSAMTVCSGELPVRSSDEAFSPSEMKVEPGCCRFLSACVSSLVLVNEQRLSDPVARTDLENTVLATFTPASPPVLSDGYNMELLTEGTDLVLLGAGGVGLGIAPHNFWEDLTPPALGEGKPIQSINGQRPDSDRAFRVETSGSLVISSEPGKLTITDNSGI